MKPGQMWLPIKCHAGQTTVEAAVLIPVLFCVLLLLLQPGILLYDRVVMEGAAAEGCRLMATRTSAAGMDDETCKELIRRHLGAIPQQDLFHVHAGGCYQIEVSGGDGAQSAHVRIANRVKLLPLFGAAGNALGVAPGGEYVLVVDHSATARPSWA